jgi:branched-chain amino acid transport system permease protein
VTGHLTFLLLGLGAGSVIAALGIGIVVTHRASGVVNFAHAATGTFIALAYYELRATGDLVLPVLGLPDRIHLVDRPTTATALVIIALYAVLIGVAVYWIVFRPLGGAPPLAGLVASLGLLLYFITLAGLRFDRQGASALVIEGPLPDDLVTLGGAVAPLDRYLLAGIVITVAALLTLTYRSTRIGLTTRAVAENRVAAKLLGISPHPIGTANWALATVLAGGALILAAPIIRLDATASSLLIVPALAAALPGRFNSVTLAATVGLALGMLQSEILNLQASWDWLPDIGLQQGIPFVLILVTLLLRGESTSRRTEFSGLQLPHAPDHRHAVPIVLSVAVLALIGMLLLDSQWRSGIIVSGITAVIALSVVVLTGFVGQVSLATYAIAGLAAFAMVRLSEGLGVPFPFAPLLGSLAAVALSIVVGFAALRTRGMTLAIATLAAAVATEELLFRWDWLTGGLGGATVEPPSLFGIDLRISAAREAFPREAFGFLVVVVVSLATIAVIMIRRSGTARRWLAVRSNERAAAAAGVDVARVKLEAFAIAGFLAGIGGTMLAYRRELVTTTSFGVLDSVIVLALVYVAGVASPLGALLAGAVAAGGLLTVALEQLSPGSTDAQLAVNGIVLIIVAIRFPSGILGSRRARPDTSDTDERTLGDATRAA